MGVCIWESASGERVEQTPPPPRHMRYDGIRSTSGRYASYWNAFLLHMFFLSLVIRVRGSIGTVLNFKGGNKEHGLKYVTCKQTFTFINFTFTTVSVFSFQRFKNLPFIHSSYNLLLPFCISYKAFTFITILAPIRNVQTYCFAI